MRKLRYFAFVAVVIVIGVTGLLIGLHLGHAASHPVVHHPAPSYSGYGAKMDPSNFPPQQPAPACHNIMVPNPDGAGNWVAAGKVC